MEAQSLLGGSKNGRSALDQCVLEGGCGVGVFCKLVGVEGNGGLDGSLVLAEACWKKNVYARFGGIGFCVPGVRGVSVGPWLRQKHYR